MMLFEKVRALSNYIRSRPPRITITLAPYSLAAALLLALASRAIVVFVAVLSWYFFPVINPNAWFTDIPIIDLFTRWDGGWYLKIAEYGYEKYPKYFYPLYPFLMKALSTPLRAFMPPLWALCIAGFAISNASFFAAVVALYRLTRLVFGDEKTAYYACAFLSLHPASVFLSSLYVESLSLALTLWTFVALEENRVSRALALASLVSLSRPVGFVVSVSFLAKGLRGRSIAYIAAALMPILPLAIFDYYWRIITGRSRIAAAIRGLTRINAKRLVPIFSCLYMPQFNFALKILFIPLFIVAILSIMYFIICKRGIEYYAYSAALLAIYAVYANIRGFPRYSLLIISIYWLLGRLVSKNATLSSALLAASASLMGLLTSVFVNWYELS